MAAQQFGYTLVRECTNMFANNFLKKCAEQESAFKNETWHAVFAFGTVIRIEFPENKAPEDWKYEPDLYPSPDLLLSSRHKTYGNNKKDYDRVIKNHDYATNVINAAYNLLMEAGYPYFSNEEGNIITFPMTDQKIDDKMKYMWGTVYLKTGGMNITTLSLTGTDDIHGQRSAELGGQKRKYDFATPRLVAIIDPNFVVDFCE